uniref:Uncharacterized protein n=1 Tax=Caenorhabditis japonica TaxID=281687 RepID=A0A8R1IUT7_CAEJA
MRSSCQPTASAGSSSSDHRFWECSMCRHKLHTVIRLQSAHHICLFNTFRKHHNIYNLFKQSSLSRRLSSNMDNQWKSMDSLSSVNLPSQQRNLSSSVCLSLDDAAMDGSSSDGSTMARAGTCAPVALSSPQGLA